jgi:hypothetical protein
VFRVRDDEHEMIDPIIGALLIVAARRRLNVSNAHLEFDPGSLAKSSD